MTLDQKIQVWNVIGTWVAGMGTLAAVVVSLRLAGRAERLRLRASVGLRIIIAGDGTPSEEQVAFTVVNLGDRAVTVNSIGWRIGKKGLARHCMQPLYGVYTHQYPKQLAHGEQATFLVSLLALPGWPKDFATGFVRDLTAKNLDTLRGLIHTSIGEVVEVEPEKELLERLRETGAQLG